MKNRGQREKVRYQRNYPAKKRPRDEKRPKTSASAENEREHEPSFIHTPFPAVSPIQHSITPLLHHCGVREQVYSRTAITTKNTDVILKEPNSPRTAFLS